MKIVLTPDWFLGSDVLIEIVSFIVLFAFFLLAIQSYKITKNKATRSLGKGFLFIAIAELATILTKVVLYYDTTVTHQIGMLIVTSHIIKSIDIFYYAGFFIYKLFTLIGLYLIYKIPLEKDKTQDLFLVLYFLVIAAFLSSFFAYLFHLTTLLLLILIIKNYCDICRKNKSYNTKILIFALGILAFSHCVFAFATNYQMYLTAQITMLISYLTLLFLIIIILEHGKKKKSKRNNL